MIKLFRRLELGRNLDIEMHDALNRAGVARRGRACTAGPRAVGPATAQTCDADLAMVVEQLQGAADGWDLALDSLGPSGRSFAADAEALGVALAETHPRCARPFRPPRSPEPARWPR